jgi:membrane protease YdiL (CAAX protease family)
VATLGVAAAVTTASAAVSYALPDQFQALGVAGVFLGGAYVMVVRHDDSQLIRHFGLSLGGIVEPEPIDYGQLWRQSLRALGWALLLGAIAFPPFWLGYVWWYGVSGPFMPAAPPALLDDVLGQLLVIALPEEAFYRGYLQTACDDALGAKVRVLGARVGVGLLLTSAIFALGHLATQPHPARLAVFFPALVFGWLRARTGGIGAPLTFHALCNLFADYLGQSYGLAP